MSLWIQTLDTNFGGGDNSLQYTVEPRFKKLYYATTNFCLRPIGPPQAKISAPISKDSLSLSLLLTSHQYPYIPFGYIWSHIWFHILRWLLWKEKVSICTASQFLLHLQPFRSLLSFIWVTHRFFGLLDWLQVWYLKNCLQITKFISIHSLLHKL